MSKLLNELRGQFHAAMTSMRSLHERADREARDLTATEEANYSTLRRSTEALRERIEAEEARVAKEMAAARPLYSPGTAYRAEDLGAGAVEIRSGADWRAHMIEGRDLGEQAELGDCTLTDFLRAVAGMRTSEVARRALSIGTDSAGGFTVPTLLMPGILDALVPASSLLTAGASIVPLEEDGQGAKSFNWPAIATLPTAAWRSEGGAVAESDPVFRNVAATPRSLAFRFSCSRELLADAMGLEQALRRAIAAAFARELDRAGLRGTGTAPEPRGILNTSGVLTVTNGANGASLASSIRWSNLMSAVQAILAADAPMPTAAIMSPRSLVGFGNLADTTNQPLQRPSTIENLRFVATSQVPVNLTVGTSNDCSEAYVGDFTTVRFVMRERPSIQLLTELYAANGQVGFICHVRADVVVTYPAALAVVTGIRP